MTTFNYFDNLCDITDIRSISDGTFKFMTCLMGNRASYIARRYLKSVLNIMPNEFIGEC